MKLLIHSNLRSRNAEDLLVDQMLDQLVILCGSFSFCLGLGELYVGGQQLLLLRIILRDHLGQV